MFRLSRIIKDYEEAGALNARVNITAAIDDRTFLTKGGDLVMMLRMHGVDYECLDASEIDQVARRFESALRTFGDDFRLYQYVLKRDHATIPARAHANPVVQQATASRIAYLQATPEDLYTLETYFVVVYEGGSPARSLTGRCRNGSRVRSPDGARLSPPIAGLAFSKKT